MKFKFIALIPEMFNWFTNNFRLIASPRNEDFISFIQAYRTANRMIGDEFYFVNYRKRRDTSFKQDIVFPETRGFHPTIRFELGKSEENREIHCRMRLSPLMSIILGACFLIALGIMILYVLEMPQAFGLYYGLFYCFAFLIVYASIVIFFQYQMKEVEKALCLTWEKHRETLLP